MHFIGDEELAADEEEIDQPDDNIRERLTREPEVGAHLRHTARKEVDEQRNARHDERIELAHPCDHDARKAHVAVHVRADHVIDRTDEQETDQSAERTRQHKRADDDLFDIDARVARGVLALADDRDLIAVFGEAQIAEDERGDEDGDENGQKAPAHLPVPQGGKVCVRQGRHGARAVGIPERDEERNQIHRDIVHHQREERLVGIEKRLEHGGNDRPDRACRDACDKHDEAHERIGQRAAQIVHAHSARKAAHEHLTVAAEVPEAHPERDDERQRDAQQERGVLKQNPDAPLRAERTREEGGKIVEKAVRRS